MTVAEERAKLKKELEKVKAEGLRVFINRSSDYYAYGLMTYRLFEWLALWSSASGK